jgi:hypothetical protein
MNRHRLYAANELTHYRTYEVTSHSKPYNAGNFIIGGGGMPGSSTKQSHTMMLPANTDYLVMVTCDEDCLDINLRVYGANGRLIGEDVRPPRTDSRYVVAEVQVPPAATEQQYRFEVENSCRVGSTGGCSYALGLNTK